MEIFTRKPAIRTLMIMLTLVAVIILSVVSAASFGVFTKIEAASINDATVKKYQAQIAAAEASRAASKASLQEAKEKTNAEIERKIALDAYVTTTQMKLDLQNEKKDILEAQIQDVILKIAQTEKDILERETLFKERLVAAYEEGNVSYLEIILGSQNLIDFFSRLDTVTTMLEYDKTLIAQSEADKALLEEIKASLYEKKLLVDQEIIEIDITKNELEAAQEESANYLLLLQQDEEVKRRLDEQAAAYQNEIETSLNKAISDYQEKLRIEEERLKKQSLTNTASETKQYVTAAGDYMWPLSTTYSRISSSYGYRTIGSYSEFHLGIDIPAGYGASIYASNAGTVLVAEYHYSYGNYVLIDHGDGKSTLYAHMSSISVTAGDSVTRGTTIGKVGSTGNSYGNHLHFEVRVSGTRVDPQKYVSP